MRIFNAIDEDMITDYVEHVPRYCSYCRSRCFKVAGYPYACRCSRCSSYFHRKFKTCKDLEYEGYDTHLCIDHHVLYLFELDGMLVQVCKGCIKWLHGEGYIDVSRHCFDFVD